MNTKKISPYEMMEICNAFEIKGKMIDFRECSSGHIHDTYIVSYEEHGKLTRYIFQRVNTKVFPNVEKVMDNILRVTSHILYKAKHIDDIDIERVTLRYIKVSNSDKYFIYDSHGSVWRAYFMIEKTRTYDVLTNSEQAYEAAKAFGRFQKYLSDFAPPPLYETIPNFHNTPKRFEALHKTIEEDVVGRRKKCQTEIDFALSMEHIGKIIVDGIEKKEIPIRVTHNDTKINNVLFDEETDKAVCVIDLDTVMPGSVLYDFGDQVRTTVGFFAENTLDLDSVVADIRCFENLIRGLLEETRSFLTKTEFDLLYHSGIIITLEIGIRFLTDYLQGDVYFKIHRPEENLERARTQIALVKSLQKQERQMLEIVKRYGR